MRLVTLLGGIFAFYDLCPYFTEEGVQNKCLAEFMGLSDVGSGIEGWWVSPEAEEELPGQISQEKLGTGSLG